MKNSIKLGLSIICSIASFSCFASPISYSMTSKAMMSMVPKTITVPGGGGAILKPDGTLQLCPSGGTICATITTASVINQAADGTYYIVQGTGLVVDVDQNQYSVAINRMLGMGYDNLQDVYVANPEFIDITAIQN
jgi:hypothetical protein